ncbi:hypothetical protein pCPXV0086 [Cowpox virus]|uniref:Uncharacterized protein n=1 Tax=Cowpox virus TaxID=10243 RepID=A0A212PQ62_COWPX|nr:hypothetical protein pCPXV0086 [Cowpox virus]
MLLIFGNLWSFRFWWRCNSYLRYRSLIFRKLCMFWFCIHRWCYTTTNWFSNVCGRWRHHFYRFWFFILSHQRSYFNARKCIIW